MRKQIESYGYKPSQDECDKIYKSTPLMDEKLITHKGLEEIESQYKHYGYTPNTYQKEDSLSSSPLK